MTGSRGAIRERIRNTRLSREQDPGVGRELALIGALLVGLVLPLLWATMQHDRFVRTGYEVESLRRELNKLETEYRELVIGKAEAESSARVSRRALDGLGLVPGVGGQRILVPARPARPAPAPPAATPAAFAPLPAAIPASAGGL